MGVSYISKRDKPFKTPEDSQLDFFGKLIQIWKLWSIVTKTWINFFKKRVCSWVDPAVGWRESWHGFEFYFWCNNLKIIKMRISIVTTLRYTCALLVLKCAPFYTCARLDYHNGLWTISVIGFDCTKGYRYLNCKRLLFSYTQFKYDKKNI